MNVWIKRFGLGILLIAIGAGFYLAMRTQPIGVETTIIETAPMTVTIEEEGIVRVRDVYTVSSPIAGHLDRSKLEEGETVIANETVIASIHPLDPPFLDDRTLTELRAMTEAARSSIALAQVERTRSQLAFELAQSEYQRASKLAKTNVISDSALEKAYSEMTLNEAQVKSSDATIRLREAELASTLAKLQQPGTALSPEDNSDCCFKLHSPVDGVILKVLARSEQAVSPGMNIAEVGDPMQLEVVVDLLSSDAPKVQPGSTVRITNWGGDETLQAVVRRIDPSAFTKTSSLGIEEQRVNAILDLTSVPEGLGHGYQILAEIEIWSAGNVLKVPIGALFRSKGEWAVFVVAEDRAMLRQIKLGKMNNAEAQVISGLEAG
ncbi:MAG: HlyD family efflux transporter periplasmic adaptor subunit, partial [Rubripirellula sp.]